LHFNIHIVISVYLISIT